MNGTIDISSRPGVELFDDDPGEGQRTTSSDALQDVFDEASATSKPISIPHGIVFTDRPLQIQNPTSFCIVGQPLTPDRKRSNTERQSCLPTIASVDRTVTAIQLTSTSGVVDGYVSLHGICLDCTERSLSGSRSNVGLSLDGTEWMSDVHVINCKIAGFRNGVEALKGGGVGNLVIDRSSISENAEWGVRIGQSVNAGRIVNSRIANNGGGRGAETDFWATEHGGGIFLNSPSGTILAGNNVEGQPTGIRCQYGDGVFIQAYHEAVKNAAIILNHTRGFEITSNYLARVGDDDRIALLSCSNGRVSANSRNPQIYMCSCENVVCDADTIVPHRLVRSDTVSKAAALWTVRERVHAAPLLPPTTAQERYGFGSSVATDSVSGPYNSMADKVTAISDHGFSGFRMVASVAGDVGDWLVGSCWVRIPVSNTAWGGWCFRYRWEFEQNTSSVTVFDGIADSQFVRDKWYLVKFVRKIETAAQYKLGVRLSIPKAGDSIHVWKPYAAVYRYFPHNPLPQ